jgi:hypothetical protein
MAVWQSQYRDSGGRFTGSDSYGTQDSFGHGANKGNQTFTSTQATPTGVQLNEASLRALLQEPAVVNAVIKHTEKMLKEANALAITDEAQYGMIVYNNRPELGAVGVVYCDNYESVIDDAYHGTLLKVLSGWVGRGH